MLGIDVSKATLSAAHYNPTTRQYEWELTVPNTSAGVRTLLDRTPVTSPLVLEPTGRFSHGVAAQSRAAGRSVLLAQPRKARAFLQAVQPRAKTDRLDSRGLALYGSCVTLAPYPLKSEAMDALDQLLSARRGLALALMQLRQRQQGLPRAADALAPAVAALAAQLKEVDRQLAQQAAALPPAAAAAPAPTGTAPAAAATPDAASGGAASPRAGYTLVAALDAIPGIGPVTAATLASRLLARSFPTPDAFVAYAGLDVRVRESGQHRGQRKLTKQGEAEVRRLLFLCAQAALRANDNPFAVQFENERKKGLSKTAATIAVARKMAKLAWSMARYQTEFDPARLYEQPKARKRRNAPAEPTA